MPYVTLPQTKTWHQIKSCKLRHLTAIALLFGLTQQTVVAAEQDWWFDVEVIIFKRETSVTELSEKFVNSEIKAPPKNVMDLLSAYLQPDLSYLRADLPFCRASERLKKQQKYEQDFAFPESQETAASRQAAEAVTKPSRPNTQDDFSYEVVNADIFDEQTSEQNQELEQDAVIQSTHVMQTSDLSVNWIEWQIPQQLPCVYREQLELLANPFSPNQHDAAALANLDRVPVKISGFAPKNKGQAFLLPQSELTLGSLYKGINKQRDLETMLHIGWRQEVKFGQNKAKAMRLFAGQNYGKTFLSNGHKRPVVDLNKLTPYVPVSEQYALSAHDSSVLLDQVNMQKNDELFNAVFAALHNDEPLNVNKPIEYHNGSQVNEEATPLQNLPYQEIWQLDGDIKVFLQNVGRTPYLHIESNMDFRQPIFDPSLVISADVNNATVMTGDLSREPNLIQSVNVSQFKRVISKQLHYFDHPLFGMVVYITRYQWPDEAKPNE